MWYKLKRILIYPDGVTEKQVYPAWWKPNANTLAYYPLSIDTKDYSWNGRDGTNSNVTFSNGIATFNWSNAMVTVADASWQRPWNNMTISLWGKANSWTHTESWQDLFLLWKFQFYSSWLYNMFYRIIIVNSTKNALWWFSSWADYSTYPLETTAPISLDTWYLYTITTEWTSKKFYLNWTLINQATSNTTTSTNSVPLTIWNWWYNNHQAYFNWNISNVILENKTWTSAEVLNYYNTTKSNYGL